MRSMDRQEIEECELNCARNWELTFADAGKGPEHGSVAEQSKRAKRGGALGSWLLAGHARDI